MIAMPGVVLEDADRVIFPSEPAARESFGGVAMTPAGSDPTVTATPPVTLIGEATTVITCAAPPGTIVIDDGAARRKRSVWLGV
jgi:hypothetical protein